LARYLDRIVARFKRQEQKGISKYGQILEDNPRGVLEALEYLAEELTDGLMYVEEAIEKVGQGDYRTLLAETEVRVGRAERQLIKLQEEVEKYRVIVRLAVLAYKSGQICGLDNGYVGRLANAVAALKGVEK
jgi:hypothetical protein